MILCETQNFQVCSSLILSLYYFTLEPWHLLCRVQLSLHLEGLCEPQVFIISASVCIYIYIYYSFICCFKMLIAFCMMHIESYNMVEEYLQVKNFFTKEF